MVDTSTSKDESDVIIDIETGVRHQCQLDKHYLTGSRDGSIDFRLLLSDQLVNVSGHHIRLTSDATGKSRSFRFDTDEGRIRWGQRLNSAVNAIRDSVGTFSSSDNIGGRLSRTLSAPKCSYFRTNEKETGSNDVLVTVRAYSRRSLNEVTEIRTKVNRRELLYKMAAFLRCNNNGAKNTVDCIRPMTSTEANETLVRKCHRHNSKKSKREPPKHTTLDNRPENDLPTIQGQLFWLDNCGQWIGVWTILKGHDLTRSPVDTPLATPTVTSNDESICQPETIDVRTWTLSYNEEAYGRKYCFELVRSDRRFGRRRCETFSTKSEGEMRIWLHRLNNVVADVRGEQLIGRNSRMSKKESTSVKSTESENRLLEKILKDRSRLRERARTMEHKHSKANSTKDNYAVRYSSFTSGQDRIRKHIIETKLNEITKCIDGDTVDGNTHSLLKEKIEDLRFELDELDIKLSQNQYRKRGSVERRNGSRVNISFQNDTNISEHKRRSLLKSHAMAFSSSGMDTSKSLKRCVSLGSGQSNRIQQIQSSGQSYTERKETDDMDNESLHYLENINNFEKLLHKMQISEFGKC